MYPLANITIEFERVYTYVVLIRGVGCIGWLHWSRRMYPLA